jgi:hypothetical protein
MRIFISTGLKMLSSSLWRKRLIKSKVYFEKKQRKSPTYQFSVKTIYLITNSKLMVTAIITLGDIVRTTFQDSFNPNPLSSQGIE